LHVDLSCTDTIIGLQILIEHMQGHLVYHLHELVAFAGHLNSVVLIGHESANAVASEVVFLGGLSSEQPLDGNLCAFFTH
jgi:hypothetical protein